MPTPTREGYTFNGWYYNNEKVNDNDYPKVNTDHTLTAQWTEQTYKVALNFNGGYFNGGSYTLYSQSFTIKGTTYTSELAYWGSHIEKKDIHLMDGIIIMKK